MRTILTGRVPRRASLVAVVVTALTAGSAVAASAAPATAASTVSARGLTASQPAVRAAAVVGGTAAGPPIAEERRPQGRPRGRRDGGVPSRGVVHQRHTRAGRAAGAADDGRGGHRARGAGARRLRHPRPGLRAVLGGRGADRSRLRGLDQRVRGRHRELQGGRHPGARRARQPAVGLRRPDHHVPVHRRRADTPRSSTRSRRSRPSRARPFTWTARTAPGSRSARSRSGC